MPLDTLRYQIVYDVRSKTGDLLAHGVDVLPDGATPPEFKLGDPWRVTVANGSVIHGAVTATLKKFIVADPRNLIVQYDFSITEL